jgi:menaquinone-dependent protoporphyrinogen oxidase
MGHAGACQQARWETAKRVLVAHASRHGATRGIAERIGSRLGEAGLDAEVRAARDVKDVSGYDAFVVGGAAYMFHWLKDATAFVKRHRAVLAGRPVWLFSSGPLGTDTVDEDGQDVLVALVPKEFPELRSMVKPRGEQVFFGAWDPDYPTVGIAEWLVRRMGKDAMPAGDFRDWPAIDAWADAIVADLRTVAPRAGERSENDA